MQIGFRLPFQIEHFRDGLRGLLGIGEQEQRIGAGVLQDYHLAVDGGVSRLKVLRADDQLVGVFAETFLEAVQQVLAKIVVLVEHAYLGF
jgi:hypothetical protein